MYSIGNNELPNDIKIPSLVENERIDSLMFTNAGFSF